ncbi:MAG: hypothetical protein ACFCD0_13500 [Gemmataceae bacterium]
MTHEEHPDLFPSRFTEMVEQFDPLRQTDSGTELSRPSRRLSVGIAKHGVEYRVILLVEREDGWAHRHAMKMQEQDPANIDVEVLGSAHAGRPEEVPDIAVERSEVLQPGLSISHFEGLPGTLGCIVTHLKTGGDEVPGLLSASHVLGNMNRANHGDRVVHPGNVDIEPTLADVIGELRNYQLLRHHSGSAGGSLDNRMDVGIAEIADENRVGENLVPSPADPDGTTIRLHGVFPLVEMPDLIDQEVYKVGRTSGFTRGVLRYALVTQQSITLTDNRVYLFRDVSVVHSSVPNQPFSKPGDSGSVVYTSDGLGIGLIIGGTDRYTLISPLEPSLAHMNAELYT